MRDYDSDPTSITAQLTPGKVSYKEKWNQCNPSRKNRGPQGCWYFQYSFSHCALKTEQLTNFSSYMNGNQLLCAYAKGYKIQWNLRVKDTLG